MNYKLGLIICFVLVLIPFVMAISWSGGTTLSSTDTNATTECTGDQMLLGNSSCRSSDALEGGATGDFNYNETIITNASMFTAYGKWWNNQTGGGDGDFDYNMTVGNVSLQYNQTSSSPFFYNMTIGGGDGDFDYNMTVGNESLQYNQTSNSPFFYNQTSNSKFFYNMTIGGGDGNFDYNFTTITNATMFTAYGEFWYNMTIGGTANSPFQVASNSIFNNTMGTNLSIGTSSSIYTLNVNGTVNITGNVWIQGLLVNTSLFYNMSTPYDSFNYNMSNVFNITKWLYNQTSNSPFFYNMTSNSIFFYNMSVHVPGNSTTLHTSNITNLNATIDSRVAIATAIYLPNNVTLPVGTLVSGNETDIQFIDEGKVYNVTEVTGTPGFQVVINYTGVMGIANIQLHHIYMGTIGHTVNVELYNFETQTYDDFGDVTESTDFLLENYVVGSDVNYINQTNSSMRINHVSAGNPNHKYFLDYAVLQKTASATQDHGSLTGLEDDDHQQYLRTDGGRNLAGNLSVDDGMNINDGGSNTYMRFDKGKFVIVLKR